MNNIPILQKENLEIIIQSGPQAYADNSLSHTRCIDAGKALLEQVRLQGGMTDELDQQIATYIEKARNTVRKMNEKRSPVTKLFDEVRSVFTSLENDVDPSKKDTVPAQLQALRNQYAAQKRAEEEARRQAEMARIRKEQNIAKFRAFVEEDYREQFNRLLNASINHLTEINTTITLDNFDSRADAIRQYVCTIPDNYQFNNSAIRRPLDVDSSELDSIQESILQSLMPSFREQFKFELESTRDTFIEMLPSKRAMLEQAAKATEEEALRLKQQMAERDAEEARKREAERKAAQDAQQLQQEAERQAEEMGNLFSAQQAGMTQYQPKVAVKRRIVPLNAEAFPIIIMNWWSGEGHTLSVEELSKIFKKQLSFCERAANEKQNPVLINSEHISYEEEVKAK